MAEIKLPLEKAVEEIKKSEKRKFVQSVDLIINLRKFDVKKTQINNFVVLPHKIKEKKICGFIETKTPLINTINKASFANYKDKKSLKNLVKEYDFFIASAQLMPAVASTFGKILGPAGKMPSPKLGILMNENENSIKELITKVNSVVRVQTKEPSIKLTIGNESMKDQEIIDNIKAVYNFVLNELPNKKENIKSVMIKLTMGKTIKAEM